jgi:hypothetical protein
MYFYRGPGAGGCRRCWPSPSSKLRSGGRRPLDVLDYCSVGILNVTSPTWAGGGVSNRTVRIIAAIESHDRPRELGPLGVAVRVVVPGCSRRASSLGESATRRSRRTTISYEKRSVRVAWHRPWVYDGRSIAGLGACWHAYDIRGGDRTAWRDQAGLEGRTGGSGGIPGERSSSAELVTPSLRCARW